MNDNKTAHMAAEYDGKIRATIPKYEYFHSETIDLIDSINPSPEKWLDTGCGTGTFALLALNSFKSTKFILADPSKEMLGIASEKLLPEVNNRIEILNPVSSQDLKLPEGRFDVITAIQAHHYLNQDGRNAAIRNCLRMLKTGGVFVTYENISPFSTSGMRIGLDRWKRFQVSQGKGMEEAERHVNRFGQEYFPITIEGHLGLLRDAGFSIVEVLWVSYMQAGFYAIKE
jgi:tRNA (cmo5U34)-methyltransferase